MSGVFSWPMSWVNSVCRKLGDEGTVREPIPEPICGRLSKWDCAGVDIVDSDEINDEMSSGEAGGIGGGGW